MNIFEFIQHLRQEHEDKRTMDGIVSILKLKYRQYKEEGKLFQESDFLRNFFSQEDEKRCYSRAYYRFERWQEIEDLKERVSILENTLKNK